MFWVTDTDPVELRANATADDVEVVIRAVYKQVLGNQHVLDGERLATAEAMFRNGEISVRGFVAMVAKSELYKSIFFYPASQYRFIELNCKHLLGRAPLDQAEISRHVQLYNGQGYDAEIDSYIYSDEYQAQFGENTVPYARSSTQAGVKNVGFNRIFALERGAAANDRDTAAKLISDLAGNLATAISAPASGSGAYSNPGKRFRVSITKANFGPRVAKSNFTFEVGFSQLSQKIQTIQRSGGKILSIQEVA